MFTSEVTYVVLFKISYTTSVVVRMVGIDGRALAGYYSLVVVVVVVVVLFPIPKPYSLHTLRVFLSSCAAGGGGVVLDSV